jgi:hypothetical protein
MDPWTPLPPGVKVGKGTDITHGGDGHDYQHGSDSLKESGKTQETDIVGLAHPVAQKDPNLFDGVQSTILKTDSRIPEKLHFEDSFCTRKRDWLYDSATVAATVTLKMCRIQENSL